MYIILAYLVETLVLVLAVSPPGGVRTNLPPVVNPGASVAGVGATTTSPVIAVHSPHNLTPLDNLVFSLPTSPNSVHQVVLYFRFLL